MTSVRHPTIKEIQKENADFLTQKLAVFNERVNQGNRETLLFSVTGINATLGTRQEFTYSYEFLKLGDNEYIVLHDLNTPLYDAFGRFDLAGEGVNYLILTSTGAPFAAKDLKGVNLYDSRKEATAGDSEPKTNTTSGSAAVQHLAEQIEKGEKAVSNKTLASRFDREVIERFASTAGVSFDENTSEVEILAAVKEHLQKKQKAVLSHVNVEQEKAFKAQEKAEADAKAEKEEALKEAHSRKKRKKRKK